ncbi:MAG: CpsD/CapB family tyrosine-protein kinase [Clostridia bacterium]|nr:CpsD/CapB family tyrosine-protein kinase [Clostridia bacterium]
MNFNIKKIVGKINETKAKSKSTEQEKISAQSRLETILDNKSNFMMVEAYKAARTNIIFTLSNVESKCKKIIITSASPNEGKTTTCLNLALAFSQTDSKVLLIGADLRKPRAYRYLKIERKNGLSDVLCGLVSLKDAIKHCPEVGIDCITAGQLPPNPVELLASKKMGEILDELSEYYDYIFIDTPPVTLVSDATAMSKYTDGVIVVVRQNYTIHETLERARNSLNFAEAKILGYIINDVDTLTSRYGSYKRYGYGYGRYYSRYSYNHYGYGYGYGYGYSDSDENENSDNKANKFFGVDEDYEKDSFIGYNHEEENEKNNSDKKKKNTKNK